MSETTVETSLAPTLADKRFMQSVGNGVEWVGLGAPAVEAVARIVAALDPIADGVMTIIAQPDVPRNLTVTVVDANNSASGVCTIRGRDFAGQVIQDVFAFGAGTKVYASSNVYAYVDSVVLSGVAGAAAGDSLSVGIGSVIGLPKPIVGTPAVVWVWFNGVPVTPDAVAVGVSKSGVSVTSKTYNGTKVLLVAYHPGL